ncbi:hypothetical protein U1Q18_008572 [Sarracenia purpurea var. burkii]
MSIVSFKDKSTWRNNVRKDEFQPRKDERANLSSIRHGLNTTILSLEDRTAVKKKKASEWGIDLNLSLGLRPMNIIEDDDDHRDVSLSLYSSSIASSSKLSRLREGDSEEHGRIRASALDLSI